MIGCSFVVNRDYFGELGLLDPGMDVYGGENIELGIRVCLTSSFLPGSASGAPPMFFPLACCKWSDDQRRGAPLTNEVPLNPPPPHSPGVGAVCAFHSKAGEEIWVTQTSWICDPEEEKVLEMFYVMTLFLCLRLRGKTSNMLEPNYRHVGG